MGTTWIPMGSGLSNQASCLWSDIGPMGKYARLGEKPDSKVLLSLLQIPSLWARLLAGVEQRPHVGTWDGVEPSHSAGMRLSLFWFGFCIWYVVFFSICKHMSPPTQVFLQVPKPQGKQA